MLTIAPAIGAGDVSLVRSAARGVDSAQVARAVHHAIELGVTFVEAAADADSERLVGDTVRALRARDRVTVATRVPARTRGTWADALPQALPASHIAERVEATLRASRLDAISLAQLPLWPEFADSTAWTETLGICARLVREGKVLAWGASVADTSDADAAEKLFATGAFAAVQVELSVCARDASALIDRLASREIAVLARRVLAGGALGGALGAGMKWKPRDDRGALDDAMLARIATGVAELSAYVEHEPPAARSCDAARAKLETRRARRPEHIECRTVAELAMRWVIGRVGVSGALVRMHRHELVAEAIAAATAPPLSRDLRARIDATLI